MSKHPRTPDIDAVWSCNSLDEHADTKAVAPIDKDSYYGMWLQCPADGPMGWIPADDAKRLADMIQDRLMIEECFDLKEIVR